MRTKSPPKKESHTSHMFQALKYAFAAALLCSLLFAHGCHGNEDNELFTSLVEWIGSR